MWLIGSMTKVTNKSIYLGDLRLAGANKSFSNDVFMLQHRSATLVVLTLKFGCGEQIFIHSFVAVIPARPSKGNYSAKPLPGI